MVIVSCGIVWEKPGMFLAKSGKDMYHPIDLSSSTGGVRLLCLSQKVRTPIIQLTNARIMMIDQEAHQLTITMAAMMKLILGELLADLSTLSDLNTMKWWMMAIPQLMTAGLTNEHGQRIYLLKEKERVVLLTLELRTMKKS
jgi:hypothetical protein